ncbi:MAG: hypothetical protein EP338_05450 [Bacteroidetes bacterium]|nr:MAG: hypothetical protein EP338_05450 [Bacteroidota bacterium]
MSGKVQMTVICFLGIILFSCGHRYRKSEVTTELPEGYVHGKVITTFAEEGCDFLIEANEGEGQKIYEAINLPDNLKKEGQEFTFKFHKIRAQRTGSCRRGIYIYLDDTKMK